MWEGLRALGGGRRAAAAVRQVEEHLRSRYGARDVLLTDSGTTALRLALGAGVRGSRTVGTAAGAGRGASLRRARRPVALPAYCCYDIATAADGADVPVVLYDLDAGTLSPDPESLAAALEAGADTVVLAPLYGVPLHWQSFGDLLRTNGARIVQDAAQASGAAYDGRLSASLGSLAVLSFGRGKGVTGGRGGALLAHDEAGAAALSSAREELGERGAGWTTAAATLAQWMLARPALYGIPAALPLLHLGETLYRDPSPPTTQPGFSAGALSVTAALEEPEAETRRRNAARILRRVRESQELRLVRTPPKGVPGYLRLPVVAPPAARRRLASRRARRLGVMPGYPRPLSHLSRFRGRCRNANAEFPGAELLAQRLFTLPCHSLLTERDLERLEGLSIA